MPTFTVRGPVPVSAPYTAQGVRFNGTTNRMTRGAALSGVTDTKLGLISFWFKMMGDDGANQILIEDSTLFTNGTIVFRDTSNKWNVRGKAAAVDLLNMLTTTSYTTSGTWHHFLAAYDLGNAVAQIYVDNADDRAAAPTIVDAAVPNSILTDWNLFGRDGSLYVNAEIADFYWNVQGTLDISNLANRAKFISGGAPVYLGADGSLPTGTAPLIFLSGPTASWQTNDATGGGFTLTGTLADASTNPP